MPTEILTDEQAAAIWSGQTSSLLGMEQNDSTTTVTTTKVEPAKEKVEVEDDTTEKVVVKEEELNNLFAEGGAEEEDEQQNDKVLTEPKAVTTPAKDAATATTTSKAGRKPDTVSVVNRLVKDGTLFGYEDDKGDVVEIKTVEEAEKLIKDNLEHREKSSEEGWRDAYKKSFSPQVQAVLNYAEQGAQSATELVQLLGAIQNIEEVADIDIATKEGQEETIRQTLKSKGFKDGYINKQITTLKDLGDEKLKEAAEELLPDLNQMRQDRVKVMLEDGEKRRKSAEEASRVYVSTIKSTLDQETVGAIKLAREDKAKLYEAVTQPKYTSLNGTPTNLFVKTLEDLQFGRSKDYNHFMNIVHYSIDPKGFMEKLEKTIGNKLADDTYRKLKTAKSTSANASADDTREGTGGSSQRRTLPKAGFTNPYS